ncbi:uncharacterized protein LOC111995965 [Quercus suber]|uniref:uncharacterized protein LOC111995965 n=1 Tax=Quercus suber TaxID=58331 RepID=UPI000CE27797|nr:uncharacterized protein LOC111995965 [Quercus suber]
MTDQPIKKFMNRPKAAGRMVQWAIELSQFDIEYHPRTAIKAQALVDFIVEFTSPDEGKLTNEAEKWKIQTDGSSARKKGGVGVVIVSPDGEVLKYGVQLMFPATNNEAEYEGILTGLRLGKVLRAKTLLVQNDSKLIPRSHNMEADEVSKMASSVEVATNVDLMMEIQKNPSIEKVPTFAIQSIDSWMKPIVSFLQDGHLPSNTDEARRIKKRAARFTILNDTLYKRGFSMPYLKCVNEEEVRYILGEIHEGICGDHASLRFLVDAMEFVKRCDQCQRFGNVQRLLAERLTTITSSWPFAQWGIDIVGPLPLGKGQITDDNSTAKASRTSAQAWTSRTSSHHQDIHRRMDKRRITVRTPTGETPFKLTYGTEAVIPVEVGVTSTRLEMFNEKANNDRLRFNLDCLDAVRDKACSRVMDYQKKMTDYYNRRVKLRRLNIGDLVLRKVTPGTRDPTQGKLSPT